VGEVLIVTIAAQPHGPIRDPERTVSIVVNASGTDRSKQPVKHFFVFIGYFRIRPLRVHHHYMLGAIGARNFLQLIEDFPLVGEQIKHLRITRWLPSTPDQRAKEQSDDYEYAAKHANVVSVVAGLAATNALLWYGQPVPILNTTNSIVFFSAKDPLTLITAVLLTRAQEPRL